MKRFLTGCLFVWLLLPVPALAERASMGREHMRREAQIETEISLGWQSETETGLDGQTETEISLEGQTELEPNIRPGAQTIWQTEALPEYVLLDGVEELLQNPELPTGCESVALTILLRYHGFTDLEKTTIAREYLPYSDNFVEGFTGDPFSEEGAGCYPPAIARAAQNYLEAQGSDLEVADISGSSVEEIYGYIAAGDPVLIWSTMYLWDSVPSGMYEVFEGIEYEWNFNEHCVVLYGYDREQGTVQVSDPLEGKITRDADRFWQVYEEMGALALVIV